MMSKHTKGPWKLHDMEERTIVGNDHIYVAGSNAGSRPDEENKANARLISAAPELLEALIDAKEHLEYCGYGDKWERECAESEGLEDKINKAIAKAEGR